jgi:hypothetical protein
MKFPSLVRSRITVAVMSRSGSVIVCEVGGGSMRLKTFQAREYCGEREKFSVVRVGFTALQSFQGTGPIWHQPVVAGID